jgi:hypothetical protein
MFYPPMRRHSTKAAAAALILVAPTTILLALPLLAYDLGAIALAAIFEPALRALAFAPVVAGFLVIAPFLALVVAAVPLTGIGLAHVERELRLTIALGLRATNLSVVGLCLVVGGLLAWHLLVAGWPWP